MGRGSTLMSQTSNSRRSRIAHFKTPFILSIAGSTALGLGCGGKTDAEVSSNRPPANSSLAQGDAEDRLPPVLPETALPCEGTPPSSNTDACRGPIWRCVDGEWEQSYLSCNPPFPPPIETCPESPAEIGTPCGDDPPGLSCEYDYCYGKTPMRRCNESTALWEYIPVPTCNPPPPEPEGCEPSMPVPGSDCAAEELVCFYAPGCNGPNSAICRSGQWVVTYTIGAACNPPAVVVPVCPERDIVTGEGCAYEGQECGPPPCVPNQTSPRLVCSAGVWRDAPPPSCPPLSVPDGGAPDGGS